MTARRVILLLALALGLTAQGQNALRDSISAARTASADKQELKQMNDSLRRAERQLRRERFLYEETAPLTHRDSVRLFRKPDAMRAVWMGAIIPGYGQIYNRSYWKLPIVYSGFVGCAYAIGYTSGNYNDYKTAYRDIFTDINAGTVTEDDAKSYIAILPEGYSLSYVGGADKWMQTLQSRQTTWRRYRDYCIVATLAVYALSLIDAYVDAQLFDFDISADLSMSVEPAIYRDYRNNTTAEMHISFRF